MLKLDKQGKQQWEKIFSGNGKDSADIRQTRDGGYVVIGYTKSKGMGLTDFWVIKLDKRGNKQWDKTYGGSGFDNPVQIIKTKDGGYIMLGSTRLKGPDEFNILVIKIDKHGNQNWSQTFGGHAYDYASAIQQTKDGGYIIASKTKSKGSGETDYWVIKLDDQAKIKWDYTFGGHSYDNTTDILQAKDGGYLVTGNTQSKGKGKRDAWLIKLDSHGQMQWDKTYGTSSNDKVTAILQTKDGGYIVIGKKKYH